MLSLNRPALQSPSQIPHASFAQVSNDPLRVFGVTTHLPLIGVPACQSLREVGPQRPALNETLCCYVICQRRKWGGCEHNLVVAGVACEGVMAAAVELSLSNSGDRSLERSCSPSLSQEVLSEIFRSLHSLVGQVSGDLWE